MAKDSRHFLEEYERDHPEDVVTIERPTSLKDEIGNLVTCLCSEQASFCVGSVIPVEGGQGRSYFGL